MEDLKNSFKNIINTKLSDPNISASDIKLLAEAYSELTKNDYMKDMYKNIGSGMIGFNSNNSTLTSQINDHELHD